MQLQMKHSVKLNKNLQLLCPNLQVVLADLAGSSFLMEYYSSHINKLIEQLSHLPGIGAKSAQRLAFHIMNMPKDQVEQLTSSITDAKRECTVLSAATL